MVESERAINHSEADRIDGAESETLLVTSGDTGAFPNPLSEQAAENPLKHSLPTTDKETYAYSDEEGERWINQQHLTSLFGVSISLIKKFLPTTPSIQGKGINGVELTLYKASVLHQNEEFQRFLSLPKVNPESDDYIDDQGEKWITLKKVGMICEGSYTIAEKVAQQLSYIQGRDSTGRENKLYKESEIRANEELMRYISLPKVDKETGVYVDERGERWIPKVVIQNDLETSHNAVTRLVKGITYIHGKDREGRETLLYKESEVYVPDRTNKFNLPKVDKETGVYVDERGERWVTRNYLNSAYQNFSDDFLDTIPSQKGRARNLNETTLYKESAITASDKITKLSLLPQVDKKKASFIDKEGEKWITRHQIGILLSMSDQGLDKFLSRLEHKMTGLASGHEIELYKESELLSNEELKRYLTLSQVDKETGVYVDEEGERWATRNWLLTNKKYSYQLINRIHNLLSVKEGISKGRVILLYKESEVMWLIENTPRSELYAKVQENDSQTETSEWETLSTLARMLGLDRQTLKRFTENIRSIRGKDVQGKAATLYNISELLALEEVQQILSQPKIGKDGSLTREDGTWAIERALAEELRIDVDILHPHLEKVSFITVRGRNGLSAKAYNKTELINLEEFQAYINRPKTQTGRIITRQDGTWASEKTIAAQLNFSAPTIRQFLVNIRSIQEKDNAGRYHTLYNQEELLALPELQEFLKVPQVAENGILVQDDEMWTTVLVIVNELGGIGEDTLKPYLAKVRSIQGRDRGGTLRTLYNRSDILTLPELQTFLNLPQVGPDGTLIREDGIWATTGSLMKTFNISEKTLMRLLTQVQSLPGRGRNKRSAQLYNQTELEALAEFQQYLSLNQKRLQEKEQPITSDEANAALKALRRL